jgi:hypothetical protein
LLDGPFQHPLRLLSSPVALVETNGTFLALRVMQHPQITAGVF